MINQSIKQTNSLPIYKKKEIKFIVASLFSKYQVSGSYCNTREYRTREITDQEGKSNKAYNAESPGSQAFEGLYPEENNPGGITTSITHKESPDNKS